MVHPKNDSKAQTISDLITLKLIFLQNHHARIIFFTKNRREARGGGNSLFQYSVKTFPSFAANGGKNDGRGGGLLGGLPCGQNPPFFSRPRYNGRCPPARR